MFDSLRQAFREAVDNFRTELRRDEVPEAADRLLQAMKRELVRTRADLMKLESEVERVRAEAAEEESEARTCLRREELAGRIGDHETVRVARDFARRHLRRKDLLQEKARVLEIELEEGRREATAMTQRFKEARLQRESLTATAGRTDARERIQEAGDLFDALDRMADRIDDLGHRGAAAEELDRALAGDPPIDDDTTAAAELDARLAALKQRMDRP